MKSVQINRYGGSEVIEINQNIPEPTVSAGKVLVNVKAAGVNPADWKIREGGLQIIHLEFPSTLGMDFSGVIKQVGEGVSNSEFKHEDEVYGQAGVVNGGSGAFVELALANKDSIAHKPKTLNHLEAAGLPLVGVSAWQALVENMGLSKDQKILIHGGAGGIGSIAIQLAKHIGAYVATTVSTNDKQFVQQLGADEVIDYNTENFEDILHDYDAVFDTVGGETYKRSFKVLKKGIGIIVSMLEQPNSELMKQHEIKTLFLFTQVNRQRLTNLAQWVDQNNIKVNVDKTFSLDEAGKALDYQKDVHPRGKVVLTVWGATALEAITMSNTRRGLPLTSSRIEKIFPKLTPEQISRIAAHGRMRSVQAGEVLIEQGNTSVPFFVVITGEVEIVRPFGAYETLVTAKQMNATTISLPAIHASYVSHPNEIAQFILDASK